MSKVIAEIKGNKYTETEIDNMLIDYINIGENIYKRRTKVIQILIKNFTKKYRKYGVSIIGKKRNLKQFLSSAKLMYELAEFYLCSNNINYNKYVYMLGKNDKGSKVYLYLSGNKELVLIYNSLSIFLENWFIYKKIGGMKIGE